MKKDIRIAFVGDSFVNGTGDPSFLGWTSRVCQYIQQRNDNIELTSYNLGIRKETSSDILQRWEKEVEPRLIEAQRHIVVFSFGVNDCVSIGGKQRVDFETSTENLKSILKTAKEKYDEVAFVMPPPVSSDKINANIKKLIGSYRKVCTDLDVKYINIFEKLKSNPTWTKQTRENDGAHPRGGGYEIFAGMIIDLNLDFGKSNTIK